MHVQLQEKKSVCTFGDSRHRRTSWRRQKQSRETADLFREGGGELILLRFECPLQVFDERHVLRLRRASEVVEGEKERVTKALEE